MKKTTRSQRAKKASDPIANLSEAICTAALMFSCFPYHDEVDARSILALIEDFGEMTRAMTTHAQTMRGLPIQAGIDMPFHLAFAVERTLLAFCYGSEKWVKETRKRVLQRTRDYFRAIMVEEIRSKGTGREKIYDLARSLYNERFAGSPWFKLARTPRIMKDSHERFLNSLPKDHVISRLLELNFQRAKASSFKLPTRKIDQEIEILMADVQASKQPNDAYLTFSTRSARVYYRPGEVESSRSTKVKTRRDLLT